MHFKWRNLYREGLLPYRSFFGKRRLLCVNVNAHTHTLNGGIFTVRVASPQETCAFQKNNLQKEGLRTDRSLVEKGDCFVLRPIHMHFTLGNL